MCSCYIKRVKKKVDLWQLIGFNKCRKPVYVTFGGQCRSYLSHFYRWIYDAHLARKLRLERHNHKSTVYDTYSYLGNHATWGNASKVFQMKYTMSFVKNEIEEIRAEKITGKRRK